MTFPGDLRPHCALAGTDRNAELIRSFTEHIAEPARYVLRTIKSPRGRIDVLKALLNEAPHNLHQDTFYDEVIEEGGGNGLSAVASA